MTQPAPSAQHNGPDKGALAGPSDAPPSKTGGGRPPWACGSTSGSCPCSVCSPP